MKKKAVRVPKARFPKDLLVRWEWDNDEPFMVVMEDGLASVETETDVAVYRLESVKRVRITKAIED